MESLESIADITCRIQSESAVTASLVVPSIVHLVDHLNNMKTQLAFLKKLCLQLHQSIEKRFSGIIKRLMQKTMSDTDPFSDPVYFVSTILDPQFELFCLSQMHYKPVTESKVKQSLLQLVLEQFEISDSLPNKASQSSHYSSSLVMRDSGTTQMSNTSIIKKQKLFQHDNASHSPTHSSSKPIDELALYMNDSTRVGFSLYLKHSQLGVLKNVVKKIFSIQASSAPVERTFSQTALIMSPRRTRMSDEVFRSLVYLRVNQQMV